MIMKNTHLFYGKWFEEILEIENYFNFFLQLYFNLYFADILYFLIFINNSILLNSIYRIIILKYYIII